MENGKIELLLRAKELVNTTEIKGMTVNALKKAANTDLELFFEYLKAVAEQAWDPQTTEMAIKVYGKELVDISKILHPEPDWIKNNPLLEGKIKGGKADKLSLKDISKKFKVEVSKLEKELNKGISVEMEHTKDKSTAKDIAMDHLSEIPDYYSRLDKMEKNGNKAWTNESTKGLIKTLLKENLKKNSAIELINDFGMFLSMNLSQVTRMGKDEAATKELNMMMKNIRGPIINGMNYFELVKDVNSIIRNPKMLSALLGKIREFLIYIEPRIQRFVIDNEFKPKWLEKIQRLKELYKNVIL